jgi:hypothetical protein
MDAPQGPGSKGPGLQDIGSQDIGSQGSGSSRPQRVETRLVTASRDTKAQKGFVNPPVVRGSTVLYPTAEDLHAIAASSSMAGTAPRPPRRCRQR